MRQKQNIMYLKICVFLSFLVTAWLPVQAQESFSKFSPLFSLPKTYVIQQKIDSLSIDGKADEKSWQLAAWSSEFADIEGEIKPDPKFRTRMKMLWDEQNLYIFAELEEPHVWAYYDQHDMIVFHENDFEVFIDPEGDTRNYFEIEINAQNTIFDLLMDKPYRNRGHVNIPWNVKGLESAVFVDGSLNDSSDSDKGWSVEMKIPFSSLVAKEKYAIPTDGSTWKINFSRVQWQTSLTEGKYIKKKNPQTQKDFPEDNWVWSPQGVINMHYPERWGLALFSAESAGKEPGVFEVPEDEVLARYLWLVYYQQQQYRKEHNSYSNSFSSLDMNDSGEVEGERFRLSMKAGETSFEVLLETSDGKIFRIDQEGKFQKPTK